MRLWLVALLASLWLAILAPATAATLDEYQAAVRTQPTSAESWDRLGQALARAQRFAEAQNAFARALKLAPGSKQIRAHVALAYAWSGDYNEAERQYASLLATYPGDHNLRIDYGQTLAWNRKYAEARREYQQVLAAKPQHVEALRHLAILTAWEYQYDEALQLLARAEKKEPRNTRVLVAKGEILSWKGNLQEAEASLRLASEIAPNAAGIWLQLGQIQLWKGAARDASAAYQRALGLQPDSIDAHLGLGRAYRENRQFDEADRILRRSLDRFPADARISKELAALAASRQFGLSELMESLEPVLFSIVLLVIFMHVRRYRRVLLRRHPVLSLLLYLLPVVAAITMVLGLLLVSGTRYHRETAYLSGLLEFLTLLILIAVIAMLAWLLRIERPARGRTILAIGAHPDDIEFGCGATLLRYRAQGDVTHALVLTGGERGFTSDRQPTQRVTEAEAGAEWLQLESIRIHDLPDTQLSSVQDEVKGLIEASVAEIKPDIVFTHTQHDIHSDHRAVASATREAVRGACSILSYENPNTPPDFKPEFFVDISDYLDDKIAAIGLHRSQRSKAYTDPEVIRAAAGFRGTQARVKYAEAFEVVRVLEKSDAD